MNMPQKGRVIEAIRRPRGSLVYTYTARPSVNELIGAVTEISAS